MEMCDHVLPSLLVILQFLQESTDTDDDVLARSVWCTDSVELEHCTSLDGYFNLQRLEQLFSKELSHQLDVISILSCLRAEVHFEQCQKEADIDAFLDAKDSLEDTTTAIQEQLYQSTVFSVIVLAIYEGVQKCKHESMKHYNSKGKIFIRMQHKLVFEIAQADFHVIIVCLPVAADLWADLPILLHASDL